MIKCLFILLPLLVFEDVPLKPDSEFEVRLDYKFKNRMEGSGNVFKVNFEETQAERERRTSSSLLPYLTLHVKLLKLSQEEVRMKVAAVEGRTLSARKITEGELIKVDLGFTDDLKDYVSPHEYNLFFLSADKKEVSRIHLLIKEDGTFLINDKVKGKF